VWNTAGGGAALLTLGLAGLAASGVLFYLDYRSRHRPAVAVIPALTVGGGVMTVSGHF
jgi:hypothetical protein